MRNNAEAKRGMMVSESEDAESDNEMMHSPPALQHRSEKSSPLMGALIDDTGNNHDDDDNANPAKNLENVVNDDKANQLSQNTKTISSRYDHKKCEKLLEEEIAIRHQILSMPGAQGKGGICYAIGSTIVNMVSAILVFVVYLISLESLLSIGLSVGFTVYNYNMTKDDSSVNGSIMDWVLLSFAVITPLSAAIRMSFTRREQANNQIANFKATMIHLYSSHLCWDWLSKDGQSGRATSKVDWLDHNDQLLHALCRICSELTRILTLPTAGRGLRRVTSYGRKQRADLVLIGRKLRRSILEDMNFVTDMCEVLKLEGLPPNEATRVRQWERRLSIQMEQLLIIKNYRTPQALRSFARIFSVFLPPFYAPYYAQVAVELNSLSSAIIFAILTSIALTALFESVFQLEDPFVGSQLDCIDVESDLRDDFLVELVDMRNYYFPNAPPFELQLLMPISEPSPEIRLFRA